MGYSTTKASAASKKSRLLRFLASKDKTYQEVKAAWEQDETLRLYWPYDQFVCDTSNALMDRSTPRQSGNYNKRQKG